MSGKPLSRAEQEQRIVRDYMQEFGVTEVDPDELTQWAINTGRAEPEPTNFFRSTKKRLVKAMRGERRIDPQGREVHTMIAIRIKGEKTQRSLWIDLLEAKPKKVQVALSQQRRSILSCVRRHKDTADSYNDNNKHGAQIPLFDYDFNKDLLEEQLPTEYPDHAPDDDDDPPSGASVSV